MDSYKEINRELILGNQELKMQQSIYQEQIIILRKQLMEEVERRVVSEKMIKIMLIDNFKNALKLLDPESSLLAVIQNPEGTKVQEHQEKQNPTRILEELRRSNSLHRRSSIVVSPTRRLTYPTQIDGENALQDMSLEEDLGLQSFDNLACIAEEIIQEEEVEKYDEAGNAKKTETIVQDTLRSLQNITVTQDMSISDIEEDNSLAADTISQHVYDEHFLEKSPPPQILLRNKQSNACYLRRSPMQDLSNLENGVVEDQNAAKLQEYNHNPTNVVVRRGKRRSLSNNGSIESVRHSQRKGGQDETEVLTLSIGMNSFRRASLEACATSMALSEMTCGQFANAPSSTPNSSQFKNSKNSSEVLQTTQTRASRRCKPTCLAEPNLNTKMRNDETKIQSARKNTKKKNKK